MVIFVDSIESKPFHVELLCLSRVFNPQSSAIFKIWPIFFSIFLIFDSFLIGYLNLLAPWSILWKWTFALKKKIIRTYFKSDVCIARRFPRTLWFLDTSSWLSLSLAYTFNVFTHVIVHQLSVGLGKHQIHRDHCLFLPLWSLYAQPKRLSSACPLLSPSLPPGFCVVTSITLLHLLFVVLCVSLRRVGLMYILCVKWRGNGKTVSLLTFDDTGRREHHSCVPWMYGQRDGEMDGVGVRACVCVCVCKGEGLAIWSSAAKNRDALFKCQPSLLVRI